MLRFLYIGQHVDLETRSLYFQVLSLLNTIKRVIYSLYYCVTVCEIRLILQIE